MLRERLGGLIGLPSSVDGTHSMRRTKASLVCRNTHNLRALQLLLGHTKMESTVRYLGVEVDDALEMSKQTEIYVVESTAVYTSRLVCGPVRTANQHEIRSASEQI